MAAPFQTVAMHHILRSTCSIPSGVIMNIGANLKRLREAANISQTDLAKKVNVSQAMICQIERGSKSMPITLGAAIAEALGCELLDLVKQA